MRIKIITTLALLLLAFAAVPASAQDEGTVTVIHGVPDLTVDVWVNGDPLLEGFEPGTITDPLTLPAADYSIEIYPAGADPEGDDPAISGDVTLPAGANATVIAHLTEAGDPALSVFVNDVSEIAPGNTRLTVRHTAAAPAVDVRAGGDPVFTDLDNAEEASADLPAGEVDADVVPAGGDDAVLGPASLNLPEGSSTIVYAIGSLEAGNLDLLVQSINGLGSAPAAVHSGTGGQAAQAALPLWVAALMIAGFTLAGAGTVATVRARR
jgi:hypothetical protein